MATTMNPVRAPWHLWLVGILGLLWNGFGAFDYVMSKTGGDEYLRNFGMTDAQIAYMNAMPAWTTAAWAIGVWSAFIATLLLLRRSRTAVPLFALSFAAFIASLVYTHALSDGTAVMGQIGLIMNAVVFAGCLFYWLYSRRMAAAGVLV